MVIFEDLKQHKLLESRLGEVRALQSLHTTALQPRDREPPPRQHQQRAKPKPSPGRSESTIQEKGIK